MQIIRLKPYIRAMANMDLTTEDMQHVELTILTAPEAHPIIKGLRGVRKARIALHGRGKSGGGRVIYYVAVKSAIYMMTAYPKNERDDLSNDQRKSILAFIESLKGN
jgi:RelE toxin of RelE / RelB toxin-antitoxin system